MSASIRTQLENHAQGAKIFICNKKHSTCIPKPYAKTEFADFCLSGSAAPGMTSVLQLTKGELLAFLANCDCGSAEDMHVDKWVPVFSGGEIAQLILLEYFSFSFMPSEEQLGSMSEKAQGVLLDGAVFENVMSFLNLNSIYQLKQTAVFMCCHASNSAPDTDATGGMHVRLEVEAVANIYPPIKLADCSDPCQLPTCDAVADNKAECKCCVLPFCASSFDNEGQLTVEINESSDSKGVCSMRGMQDGGNMTCGCCICCAETIGSSATPKVSVQNKRMNAEDMELRTVEKCDELHASSSKAAKPGGAQFKNVIRPQLLNMGPENTVPTPLHIMLGEGNYIIGMILRLCRTADTQAAHDGHGSQTAAAFKITASALQVQIDELKEKQQCEMPTWLAEIKAGMKKDNAKFRAIQSKLACERPPRAISNAHVKHWQSLK